MKIDMRAVSYSSPPFTAWKTVSRFLPSSSPYRKDQAPTLRTRVVSSRDCMIGLRVPSSSRTSEMSASFEIGVACEPARAPTGTLARCGRSIACGSGNAAFAAGKCPPAAALEEVAGPAGFEPAAFGFVGQRPQVLALRPADGVSQADVRPVNAASSPAFTLHRGHLLRHCTARSVSHRRRRTAPGAESRGDPVNGPLY